MKKILSAEQMKRCDAHTIEALGVPSRTLMQRAALACANALDGFDLTNVCVLCGAGNNGGDGMAIADILSARQIDVTVVFAGDEKHCTPESAYRLGRLQDLHIPVIPAAKHAETLGAIAGATTVIDALFGVGLTGPAKGEAAALIEAANESKAAILAVDVPSGLWADGGKVAGAAIHARRTVAIQNLKPCHVLYPAALCCGEVRLADIGIGDDIISDALLCATDDDLAEIAPRPEYSNKGTFGRVLVIAGCEGMAGAAYLSALAAYRTGAGLVEVFTVEANRQIIQTLLPEAVVTVYGEGNLEERLAASLARADTVVCGPGLGTGELSRRVVKRILDFANTAPDQSRALERAEGTPELSGLPIIFDADALNIVAAEELTLPRRASLAVTPHVGEMARLTGKPIPEIAADIVGTAQRFAAERGVVCVLKDAHTVICDGKRTYVNLAGCSAMAKGGSGDVLTGIIAALAASGEEMDRAAVLGCFLHGRAGERAAAERGVHGVLARDIANAVRR